MDEKILAAITELTKKTADLTAAITENFRVMQKMLTDIESRLEQQKSKTRRMSERQRLQEKDIEELKKIVLDLAERKPIKRRYDGVAVSKEEAYRRFAGKGIGKVTATRALRDAGMLATDKEGKCTITIWNNGGYLRVLLITPRG